MGVSLFSFVSMPCLLGGMGFVSGGRTGVFRYFFLSFTFGDFAFFFWRSGFTLDFFPLSLRMGGARGGRVGVGVGGECIEEMGARTTSRDVFACAALIIGSDCV